MCSLCKGVPIHDGARLRGQAEELGGWENTDRPGTHSSRRGAARTILEAGGSFAQPLKAGNRHSAKYRHYAAMRSMLTEAPEGEGPGRRGSQGHRNSSLKAFGIRKTLPNVWNDFESVYFLSSFKGVDACGLILTKVPACRERAFREYTSGNIPPGSDLRKTNAIWEFRIRRRIREEEFQVARVTSRAVLPSPDRLQLNR